VICYRVPALSMTFRSAGPKSRAAHPVREGWQGWDEYAPFYDWENARTLGRRDVPFWRRVARRADGPVLELGCGTGRVTLPLASAGVEVVGIDRSAEMLARARRRATVARSRRRIAIPDSLVRHPEPRSASASRAPAPDSRVAPQLVRGDIRALPFSSGAFQVVLAPYGILQSLVRDTDLSATLDAVARVMAPGGTFGIDLVPDVPNWREYSNRIQLRGKAAGGAHLTLVESVRQDRTRRLTTFEQRYIVRRGRQNAEHRFELTFRTLSVRQMTRRLERAGFEIETVLGDYQGRPWDARADVWIILAKKM
jgi:ubiquinone/menaquinone biosynthesis C-methylase UbiE